MQWFIDLLTLVYIFCAVALAVYASGTFVLLMLWQRRKTQNSSLPDVAEDAWPVVLVQLPVFNERLVISRLIDAVAALDYPRDSLCIQVLDDSTDETSEVIARCVAHHHRAGLRITHVQRDLRAGYKAGALQEGLACHPEAAFVAVFDADFVPDGDFLRQTVPHFLQDDRVGMVQTRWGHLNAREGLLTQAQALSLDGHFVVEQTARSRNGLLLNFSGSAGIWCRACIEDAGGWSFATLAEDLDLSYRAQLRGWSCLYLPDVVVPAEIPVQMAAYRQQQARWAKGSTQNLLLHGGAMWRHRDLSLAKKVMGSLHLFQYVVHPLMLILLLLTPPLLVLGHLQHLSLAPLGLAGLGPPLVYLFSQRHLYPDWARRLLAFPVLMGLGTGLVLSNSLAVLGAVRGEPNVFRRTPKFDRTGWAQSGYALRQRGITLAELGLALYAAFGAYLALSRVPSLVPFLVIYALAFGLVTAWELVEAIQLRRVRVRRAPVHEHGSI